MAQITLDRLGRGGFRATEQGTRLLGADALVAALDGLSAAVRTEILTEGLRAGAEVIRASAATRVADDETLANALAVEITAEDGRPVARIGPRAGKARGVGMSLVTLAYWREFGTKAHRIVAGARARRVLKSTARKLRKHGNEAGAAALAGRTKLATVLSSGTEFFGTDVQHPGTAAQPFLRPAFDEDGPEATRVMGQTMWARLRALSGTR